jgi:hypothetical protein
MTIDSLRVRILLSLQRALLGEVFPSLRSLWAEWTERGVLLRWHVEGSLSGEDQDSVTAVEADVLADCDPIFSVESEIVTHAPDVRRGQGSIACVFKRREG